MWLQRRHIRRWRRRRGYEQILQNPFAALHYRRSIWIGGYRQEASLAQQSAPVHVLQHNFPERRTVNIRHTVEIGKSFIQERVVGSQQIEHAAIVLQHAAEE